MNNSGVYYLKNTKKNIFYIGSSANINRRIYQHMLDLKKGRHINKQIQADFNAGDIFIHGIIETTPEKSRYILFNMERATIKEYKNKGFSLYNVCNIPDCNIDKKYLVEQFATLYCLEHYGVTYPQFTAHFTPAEYTLHYLMLKTPEKADQLKKDFEPLIKQQKRDFYYNTHEKGGDKK